MKSKQVSIFLLTLIMSLALVCAANFTISTSPIVDLTKTNANTSFKITLNAPTNFTGNLAVALPQKISDGKGNDLTLNPPYSVSFSNVAAGQTVGPVSISYTAGTVPANFFIGKFSATANITATDTLNSTNTLTQTVPIYFVNDFCTSGENGTDLSISNVNFDNSDGDDTEWTPLDEITIKVEVSNDGSERVKEVVAEIGLIDTEGKNVIKNMDNLNNRKVDLGTINDGSDKTAEFKFRVPVDFNEGDYEFVVKAYSDDKGQKNLCIAHSSDLDANYYQIISSERETDENKQVIVDNVILSPETAQCGDQVQVSLDVVNIGDTDYSDQFKVVLYNKDLKLNEEQVAKEDLDQGDSKEVQFEFTVPASAAEKNYVLEFRTYYDFDDGDNSYNLISDDTFTKVLKVAGNCQQAPNQTTSKAPQISADFDPETPEAVAGKEVIITATIKNQDAKETTYTIGVSDNSAWSDLVSVDPKTLTIAPGDSKDVTIILNVNKDVTAGDKSFTIKASYDNQQTQKTVLIPITKSTSGLEPIAQNIRDNWFIYVIIIVNVILIIAIIIVIRRMMRPRSA